MIFRKIRHNRTADAVVDQIEELILHGVLRPGDRLPSERDLAPLVDVSRPILRLALKELEERGLIQSRHGGGTFVADVIGTVFSPAIVELVRRHPPAIADYLEYRREIERVTARFAAVRATEADRRIITDLFEAMCATHAAGDFDREAELDLEFHQAIGEAAHNIVLLHTLRSCYRLLVDGVFYNRAAFYRYSGSSEKIFDQHRAIYEALMRGDPDVAGAAAVAHIDFIEQVVHDVARAGTWDAVSELRLEQRRDLEQKRDPARREPARRVALRGEAARQPARQEPAEQDPAQQETGRQDAGRQDAGRQEARQPGNGPPEQEERRDRRREREDEETS